jgi:hypothetical protein
MVSRTELSLIELLKGGGFAASIITTFNAYLPFYESVILPKLRAAGARHNIVLMDAGECAKALAQPDTAPRLAGRAYTLVPIQSGGAFHPKILLVAGKSKAVLHVGSHNLTLSGFGKNAELTGLIATTSKEAAGTAVVGQAWRAILGWVQREAERLPNDVRTAVKAVEQLVPWLAESGSAREQGTLLVQARDGSSLWQQISSRLPAKISAISVVGAFFDTQLAFLKVLQDALPKGSIQVAIDPQTVSLPCDLDLAAGFDWRDGSTLSANGGYLHAKAVWIRAQRDDDVLLVGSANPSAPAWLSDAASRNDEAMLVLSGQQARQAATGLGLDTISSLPRVGKAALREVVERGRGSVEREAKSHRPYVASLEGRELAISADGFKALPANVLFLDHDGNEIGESVDVRVAGAHLIVAVPDSLRLGALNRVRLVMPRGLNVEVIVHRSAEIADLCRTGTQQALRVALERLGDDAHDIGELVSIVEKAIFSDQRVPFTEELEARAQESSRLDAARPASERPDSLVVSAKDMKQRHARHRILQPGSDLAYLLDVLFRELRVDSTAQDVDEHGRSEEEQIGKDDEETPKPVRTADAALAKLCRGKVSRLVRRAIDYVDAAAESTDKHRWFSALVKLAAVLAVLRELRVIEQLPRWRTAHERLVPTDALDDLLEGVLPLLFRRNHALLWRAQEALGNDAYEELARLKGLLLWLAWDCHVSLEQRYSVMEEPEQLWLKLWDKAALLEIAQYLPGDDLFLAEAHQSVMRCSTPSQRRSAAAWVREVTDWCERIARLVSGGIAYAPVGTTPALGGLAFVSTGQDRHLRVVTQVEPQFVSLLDFSEGSGAVKFARERVVSLQAV